jgi:hypothetical protein
MTEEKPLTFDENCEHITACWEQNYLARKKLSEEGYPAEASALENRNDCWKCQVAGRYLFRADE